MSDFRRFEEGGGELTQAVQLYLDMNALHGLLRVETAEALEIPLKDFPVEDIAYQFADMDHIGFDGAQVVDAQALSPMQLFKTKGFIGFQVYLLGGTARTARPVELPRLLQGPFTDTSGAMGVIAVSTEASPFIVNALDVDAAHSIAQVQRGEEPTPALDAVPDVSTYFEVMQGKQEGLHFLKDSGCAVIRSVLPQLRHNVTRTIEENELT